MTANMRIRTPRSSQKPGTARKPPTDSAPSVLRARNGLDLVDLLTQADPPTRSALALDMQARLGNSVVQRLVVQAKAKPRAGGTSNVKGKPKLKVVPKPKAPPPTFTIFGAKFKVVSGTVRPAAKKGSMHGWTFTAQAPAPAGPGATPAAPTSFDVHRTMTGAAWRPATGSPSTVIERTTIQVSGSTATVSQVVAEPQGTTMSIPLDDHEHPAMKSLKVGSSQADALDVPAGGLSAGDTLKLRNQVFVFSALRPDTGSPVEGLFFLGRESHLQGGVGVEGADVAPFATTFAALASGGKISAAEQSDQAVFDFLAEIEGGFGTVQTADTGVVSFGFAQWTAVSDLPPMLSRVPKAAFDRYLGKYGLGVGTPVLGTPGSVRKFVPTSGRPGKLNARNPSEHCLTLNGVELVADKFHTAASSWSTKLTTLSADAQAAKAAWLAAATPAKKKAVAKTIRGLWSKLAGLPGVPAKVPKALSSHPDQMADHLASAATTAQALATAADAGTASVEEIRTNEWALRFQVAGRDEDVQVAEVHQAHDSYVGALAEKTAGVPNSRLMQTDRAHAVLFSSWINAGPRALQGVTQAVHDFRADKVSDPKSKADWEKFPWPITDAKWTTTFDPVSDDFESVAEDKLLKFTFDPVRRKKLLNKHFP